MWKTVGREGYRLDSHPLRLLSWELG